MLQLKETYVNRTKGYQFGESDWYEPFTDDRQKLFLDLQREFGRRSSKMYVDLISGGVREIGWVFEKKMQYEDSGRYGRKPEFYIREVWVEVREIDDSADTEEE